MRPYLLHDHLAAAANRTPDAIAIVDGERRITYKSLHRRSDQMAALLQEIGVRRGDRVALYLDKSIDAYVGLYGILKAGAAYVPLDPLAPPARLCLVASNCDIRCAVTNPAMQKNWLALVENGAPFRHFVVIGEDPVEGSALHASIALHRLDESSPAVPRDPDCIDLDLSYVLYTSGSTGIPKGVMLSHRNALAFTDWARDEIALTSDDRVASHAPLHFDISTFDFSCIMAGAQLDIVPPSASMFPGDLARYLESHAISVWYSVPAVLTLLALGGGLAKRPLPALRSVLFAGEVFPIKHLRHLMSLVPAARFYNLYGPTETNVCTYYEVERIEGDGALEPIPIGRAVPNDEVFALDEAGEVIGPGQEGELFVRGATVMVGYWGMPEQTAKVLVPDPRGGQSVPAYRTGDLVRLDERGNFHFLGRRDHQVKCRGYRIELADVEAAIYAHPQVIECAAIAVRDDLETNRLYAYLVVREALSERELVNFLTARTSHYMIPERFEFCESLPKSVTGKIDRRRLAADFEIRAPKDKTKT